MLQFFFFFTLSLQLFNFFLHIVLFCDDFSFLLFQHSEEKIESIGNKETAMASSTEGNDGKQSEPEAHEQQNQMESTESSNQQGQQNDMQTATIASSEGHNEHEESSNLNQVDDSQAQQGEEDGDQLDQESDQRSLRKEKKQQRPDKRCRFYEKRFPKLEEVVMVVVKNIAGLSVIIHNSLIRLITWLTFLMKLCNENCRNGRIR